MPKVTRPHPLISTAFLMILLGSALYWSWLLFQPYAIIILLAAIFATVFYPVYKWFLKKIKSRNWSAFLTSMAVVFCIILPVIGVCVLLVNQSIDAYFYFEAQANAGAFNHILGWISAHMPSDWLSDKINSFVPADNIELLQKLMGTAQDISTWLVNQLTIAISSTASLLFDFFLMMFTLFFFFKDGETFMKQLFHLSPLSAHYESELFAKLSAASNSVMMGTFLTAIIQGLLGAIGFWVVGLPPAVWGVVMAFFSLVPLVGTAIIWVPVSIVLLISGDWFGGIFLMIWGAVVVSGSDNFIRPLLMKGKMQLHSLLIFFSILGGVSVFGFLGILFGPLIIALTSAILQIYEMEYHDYLEAGDNEK